MNCNPKMKKKTRFLVDRCVRSNSCFSVDNSNFGYNQRLSKHKLLPTYGQVIDYGGVTGTEVVREMTKKIKSRKH